MPYQDAPASGPTTTGQTELDAQRQLGPLSSAEAERIVAPDEPWSDRRAKDFVKRTFNRYETYRLQNYDRSYRRCDDVYMAVTKNKTWENTRIPRASIPIWMGVQQIEALLPHAIGALFADDFPFECFPRQGTTFEMARAVRDLLRDQIDDLNPDIQGMTLREIVRRAYKSSYVYGIAPVEFGWQMSEKRQQAYTRRALPETVAMRNPMTGQVQNVPTGQVRWSVDYETKTYRVSKPKVQNIEPWDYFFDPNLKSHNPQEGQGVAIRQLLPISWLKTVCLPEFGYKIPKTDDEWKDLASTYKQTMAEVSRSWGEMDRGNYYNPSLDANADPADARIEVVRWCSKDRWVWLLGREWVAYNKPNELGVINFLNPFYIDVVGRHVGLGICDIIEGDQRLAQAIIEARIDELNLMIHPPIVRKLGVKVASSQRRLRPGVEWEAENPKEDIIKMDMGNVTQSAYVEVAALEQRVQKATGVTDLAALGAPAAGGNSANRTATGVQTQSAATGVRIQYQVENGEDQFIVPMLNMLLALNQKYQDPNQPMIPVSLPNGQAAQVDPLDILNSSVRFKMKASDKLRLRRALAGGGIEAVLQFLANIQGQLMEQGLTADWKSAGQLIADAFGLPDNTLIRPMTQQEQQAVQQMRMAPEMMKMQQLMARMQALSEMSDNRDDTKLITEFMKLLKSPETAAEFAGQIGLSNPMDLLQQKAKPKQIPAKGGK